MTKLKTILLYNASKYIHIAFFLSIALYIRKQPLLLMAAFVYGVWIFKKSKSLWVIILIISSMVLVRIYIIDHHQKEAMPMVAEVLEVDQNKLLVQSKYRYLIHTNEAHLYQPGMVIEVFGRYLEEDPMEIPHTFNYQEYLKTQRIMGRIKASHIDVVDQKYVNVSYLRFIISNHIDQQFSSEVSSMLHLLVLGVNRMKEESIYKDAQTIGITHLFAISGLHLTVILLGVNNLLKRFYMKKRTELFLISLILIGYNVVTGFTLSIARATLLFLLMSIARIKKVCLSSSDILTFIFIGFIIYNPYMIYHIGFQLSFLVTFSILLIPYQFKKPSLLKKTLYTSILATLISLPIILSIYKQTGIFNALYNPMFIFYVSFFLLPFSFVVFVLPKLAFLYQWALEGFYWLIHQANVFNVIVGINMNHWMVVCGYWVLLIWSLTNLRKYIKNPTFYMIWLLVFVSIYHSQFFNLSTKVIIFDINQGDAIFIQDRHCRLLIDTGNKDPYDGIINYFKGENIRYLDAVVITHRHQDHYGEINDILKSIHVENLYVNHVHPQIDYENQIILKKSDVLKCGNLSFVVLNAFNNDRNENNNSIVLFGEIGGEGWLFTGDIESQIELHMVKEFSFDVTHLKVSHHGSKTSTTTLFIDKIRPENAYISSGINTYDMPHKEIIERLDDYGVNIYHTRTQGTIVVQYFYNTRRTHWYKHRYYFFAGDN